MSEQTAEQKRVAAYARTSRKAVKHAQKEAIESGVPLRIVREGAGSLLRVIDAQLRTVAIGEIVVIPGDSMKDCELRFRSTQRVGHT